MKPLFREFSRDLVPGSWEGHCRIKVHSVKPINSHSIIPNTPFPLNTSLWFSRFLVFIFTSFLNTDDSRCKTNCWLLKLRSGGEKSRVCRSGLCLFDAWIVQRPRESPEDHPPPLLLFDEEHEQTNVCSIDEKVLQVWLWLDRASQKVNRREKADWSPGSQTHQTNKEPRTPCEICRHHHSNNGGVSDSELARFVETSRASVNRIRHDMNYSYKPLRHGPFLKER